MPSLDVSDVVTDPELADTFTVTRREDVVGDDGRTTPTETESFPGTVGVITQQDPSEMMRRDDATVVPRRIFVATRFKLRGASQSADGTVNYQPDVISWEGTDYTVTQVLPYQRYGRGITEAVAESGRATDVPQ